MYRSQTPDGWTQVDIYARLFRRDGKLTIETLPEAPKHLKTIGEHPETMWTYNNRKQQRIVFTVYLDGVDDNTPAIEKVKDKLQKELLAFVSQSKPLYKKL